MTFVTPSSAQRSSVRFWLHATTSMPSAFATGTIAPPRWPAPRRPSVFPASGIGNPVCQPPARMCRSSTPIRFATAKISAHAISDGAGRPRGAVAAGGTRRGAPVGLGGSAEQDSPLDPGLVVDDVARPAVADEQLQAGEAFEHRAGEARPLLGDDDDLVVGELVDEPFRRDRLAEDGDLGVGGQRRPVAVLQGDADVIVEDRDLRHAHHLASPPAQPISLLSSTLYSPLLGRRPAPGRGSRACGGASVSHSPPLREIIY